MGRRPSNPPKEQITRRIRVDLMERVREFASSRKPVVTDTAVIEDALEEYLDRHEPKTKKEGKQ